MKIKKLSAASLACLSLLFFACGQGGNTAANNSTANSVNTTSTNSNRAAVSNASPAANTSPSPSDESGETAMEGELQVGKTESVILYVGAETGDYAAYCFSNDSEAGRAILAACKEKEQCSVTGTVEAHECKVPGLEATLSDSGRIVKVKSAKSLGRKK